MEPGGFGVFHAADVPMTRQEPRGFKRLVSARDAGLRWRGPSGDCGLARPNGKGRVAARPGDAARRDFEPDSRNDTVRADAGFGSVQVSGGRRAPPPARFLATSPKNPGEVRRIPSRWRISAPGRLLRRPLRGAPHPRPPLPQTARERGRTQSVHGSGLSAPGKAPLPRPLVPRGEGGEPRARTKPGDAPVNPSKSTPPPAQFAGGGGRAYARPGEGAHSTRRTRHPSSTAATTSDTTSPAHTPRAPQRGVEAQQVRHRRADHPVRQDGDPHGHARVRCAAQGAQAGHLRPVEHLERRPPSPAASSRLRDDLGVVRVHPSIHRGARTNAQRAQRP